MHESEVMNSSAPRGTGNDVIVGFGGHHLNAAGDGHVFEELQEFGVSGQDRRARCVSA